MTFQKLDLQRTCTIHNYVALYNVILGGGYFIFNGYLLI